jgi:putative hydrolase of HD superfamily
MGHHYIDFREAEKEVFADQIAVLDKRVKEALRAMRADYEGQLSKESIIARDADILECLIQAKEYVDLGFPVARTFFKRAPDYLKTQTAQKLWQETLSWDSHAWWQNVVKFER